ncbi:MAG: ATP-dependent sacrificial sulfur transferase LarE [Deltaproteobacteria bacterium]|nr:ATP-dependent sacrificial sulfur transferase LarE [Deltaproteobacteria bacterium]
MEELRVKEQALEHLIRPLGKVLVCFSGGADSSLLLFLCLRVLGPGRVTAFTAITQASRNEEAAACRDFAKRLKIPLVTADIDLLTMKPVAEGSPRRCYFCKKSMFELARREAKILGIDTVVEGSNRDDRDDYRPGFEAVAEFGVRSPLLEAGLTKEDIRRLSRQLALPTWDQPAGACLLTRFPYGVLVTSERLARVKGCETLLRSLGFSDCRVRFHQEAARIEVPEQELPRFADPELRRRIVEHFRKAGFLFVTLDLEGYRRGSLNTQLAWKAEP